MTASSLVDTSPILQAFDCPPICRVPNDIADLFADEMDILSLTQWRRTCRTNYVHVVKSLNRALIVRLARFVPAPQRLADIVASHGAVFGGELALSFILRLEPYDLQSLDIYAGSTQYESVCDSILEDLALRRHTESHVFLPNTPIRVITRLVAETMTIHLSNGRTLHVHQSYTSSPTAPISRLPCTALSNFVTSYGFACSHPQLTLAHRSLLADRELVYLTAHDSDAIELLLTHNFSISVSPSAWPEYRRDIQDGTLLSPEECWRYRYICPNQGRFFGDRGSFVEFFDPLGGDAEHCSRNNIPPFGPMVMWRLLSTFQCDDGCEILDDVVDLGVTSVPVLFRCDPHAELSAYLSDRQVRSSGLYRTFGWSHPL